MDNINVLPLSKLKINPYHTHTIPFGHELSIDLPLYEQLSVIKWWVLVDVVSTAWMVGFCRQAAYHPRLWDEACVFLQKIAIALFLQFACLLQYI